MAPMSADDGAPEELDTLHDVDAAATGGAASAFAVGGFAERYERGEPLGAGGMGVVQAWRDRATGREVAARLEHPGRREAFVLPRVTRDRVSRPRPGVACR
jgi:hypothetical protein